MDKKSSWDNTMSMTWNLFDDSHVTTYSVPTNFESDCFGDKYAGGGQDDWAFGQNHSKSAYMLVYERKQKSPVWFLLNETHFNKNLEIF